MSNYICSVEYAYIFSLIYYFTFNKCTNIIIIVWIYNLRFLLILSHRVFDGFKYFSILAVLKILNTESEININKKYL